MKDDTISRAAALSALNGLTEIYLNNLPPTIDKADAVGAVNALPPAQPEPEEFEWCHTCREYDQEKHCCHRWTKVIRKTVDDMKAAQPGWIPTSERLPDNDRAVLVTLKWAEDDYEVAVGEYWHNSTASHGWGSFEGHVIAWHELPTPYREGGQDNGFD